MSHAKAEVTHITAAVLGFQSLSGFIGPSFLGWDDLDFQFVACAEALNFGILEPIPGEEMPGSVFGWCVGFCVRNLRGPLFVDVDGTEQFPGVV
jgi:hypothetical protein